MFDITAGFLPLTDSAILLVAKEMGFAEEHNISLNLERETSWANIRDRLAVKQFEIAHCLAPMPIAANLDLTPFPNRLIAPMALGLGGNAITVSNQLYDDMSSYGSFGEVDAKQSSRSIANVIKGRAKHGKKKLHFAVVHSFSAHNFELRYWLAASGVNTDFDVEIVILPPSLMADALASDQIDGFCVGEPWNSFAVAKGVGKIATVKSAIWASSPEKVLAMNADWAERNDEIVKNLLQAFYSASQWAAKKENLETLAKLLSKEQYLNKNMKLIMPALDGSLLDGHKSEGPFFFDPHGRAATFPWQSHALWFYSQMVRWGYVDHDPARAITAQNSFRPDLYRAALSPAGVPVPSANSKVEGALKMTTAVGVSADSLYLGPDGFFDDQRFDPDQLDEYIENQR